MEWVVGGRFHVASSFSFGFFFPHHRKVVYPKSCKKTLVDKAGLKFACIYCLCPHAVSLDGQTQLRLSSCEERFGRVLRDDPRGRVGDPSVRGFHRGRYLCAALSML